MVDIEQDGVETAAGRRWIEAFGRSGQDEEIGQHEAAARIAAEDRPEGNEPALVPFDDGRQGIDDDQLVYRGVFQRRHRRVTEPQPAHDDIPRSRLERRQPEIGERDFHDMEEARHQKGVAKDHFVDFKIIQPPHAAAAQRKIAQRGFLKIEFGEIFAHRVRGVISRHPAGKSGHRTDNISCGCESGRSWSGRQECPGSA